MKFLKSYGAIFLLALGVLAPAKVSAEATTSSEYQAVVDTAYNYFNGIAQADMELMGKAFDMEAGHIKYVVKDKETGAESVQSQPLSEFAARFKEATKDAWKAKILSVDIVDDRMAMVKLDFDTPKTHYVDYLVMYKRAEGWRIINKTYVMNRKSK